MLLVPVRPYVHCKSFIFKCTDTTDERAAVAITQTCARITTACVYWDTILLTLRDSPSTSRLPQQSI